MRGARILTPERANERMKQSEFMLAAMAEIGALRNLVIHALALRLIEEPAPLQVLELIGHQLTASPTQPGDTGGALDPAMSDYLAALTDERMQSLVEDLRQRVGFIAS